MYDVIVIGGGPAGYTAALYAARAGLSTVILERMTPGGQMALTDVIDNYPGFPEGVDGFTLGMDMQKCAERFGAVTAYADVFGVELAGSTKRVKTATGDYEGRTVILATGANPRPLGLEGEEAFASRGVHYCAHCDGRFYKDKTVAVVGGGNSAVGDALYLARLAKKVYLIHRRDTLRASKVYSAAIEGTENLTVLYDTKVASLLAEGKKLTGVSLFSTKDGKESTLSLDGLFVSIGRMPVTDFLEGALPLDGGYIVADESTKTAIPGVFAVGDVRTKALRQVVTAVADGAVAAHFAEEYLAEQEQRETV